MQIQFCLTAPNLKVSKAERVTYQIPIAAGATSEIHDIKSAVEYVERASKERTGFFSKEIQWEDDL